MSNQSPIHPSPERMDPVDADIVSEPEVSRPDSLPIRERIDNGFEKTKEYVKSGYSRSKYFYRRNRNEFRHYALVTSIVLFAVVLFQNVNPVQVEFFFWSFTAPKVVLFFGLLLIGYGLGYLAMNRRFKRLERKATNPSMIH